MRATYRRQHGTEQFLGFYDVHTDCLSGLFRKRKRLSELGEAFRRLRACYPRRRLLVILDNLHNTHDHPRFLALLRRLRIHPVWTPTDASWLNLIEAQFGVLKRFTLRQTDDPSHLARRRRIYRYLRYRHQKLGLLHHPLNRIRAVRPIKLECH
jgi:transposase